MNSKWKKGPTFLAKRGNAEVPVYTIRRGCPNEHHVVCYYQGGRRQRRSFSNLEKAKAEAVIIATKLSSGDLEAIRLTGLDRQVYLAAQEHLRSTGITLDSAARDYATAHRLLGGYPVLEAVRFYVQHRQGRFTPRKVSEVVAELLEQKESKKRSAVYLKDLRGRLIPFAGSFRDVDIHEVQTAQIEAWLNKLNLSPRSLNNYLRAVRTLFGFAATRKYLTGNHPGATEVEWATEDPGEIDIYTPDELIRLFHSAKLEMIPYLALAAFAGIRSAELQRLIWTDVKLDKGFIEIKRGKAKTRSRRLVPISDNLRK